MQCDNTLFVKLFISHKVFILIVYVDDVIMIADDHEDIKLLK